MTAIQAGTKASTPSITTNQIQCIASGLSQTPSCWQPT